jgi:hypothetical protein
VRRSLFITTLVCLFVVAAAARPAAQAPEPATRAEALRQEREKKEQALTPNRPDGLKRAFDFVEGRAIHILNREGWYPKIGTITTGSGFAFGAGYRDRDLLRRHGVIELWGAGSIKAYWATQARIAFPELANGRLMLEGTADLRDYPKEQFFGIGPDSRRDEPIEFALRLREFGGRGGIRLAPVVLVGGGGSLFTPRADARGVASEISYAKSTAFVEVDYADPVYARQGGWYRINFSHYHDRDGGPFSFNRTDVDLRQFIGLFAERRVIALRGWLATTHGDQGADSVPFYLMPTLGGNDTLRGFRNYRFRGPHAMLLQAEYRWEIWSGLDAALFYDAGKVTLRRDDLSLKGLEKDYGFGFRFNTSEGVILRVDAAFGSRDGKHLHIVFGGVF